MVIMDDNFGTMIYNGTILDLSKTSNDELQKIIDDLEEQQVRKKNKLMSILSKISEEK